MGEVIVDGTEIYGEGVNVAARLEALADPGGVWLSGAVADQVRHRIDVEIEDMGDQRVKNIALPIRAYRVAQDQGSHRKIEAAPITDRPSIQALTSLFEFFAIFSRARFSATFFSIERTSSGIFFPNCL